MPAAPEGSQETASTRDAGALARRWCDEIFSQGRLESADDLFDPKGVLFGGVLGPQPVRSAAELKTRVEMLRTAFPDLQMQVSDLAREGEKVAMVCTLSGTHLGDGLGVPATGQRLEVGGMSMSHWRGGRMLRGWLYFDLVALYGALGLLTLFDQLEPPVSGAWSGDEGSAAAADVPQPPASPTSEANRALALRWCEEVYNQGRLETLEELFDPTCVIRDGGLAGHPIQSADAFKQQAAAMRGAFPDLHLTVAESVADGELVGFRGIFRGTHLGEGLGVSATGRKVEVRGMSMGRWRNGRMVEGWNRYDLLGLYRSLGLLRLFQSAQLGS